VAGAASVFALLATSGPAGALAGDAKSLFVGAALDWAAQTAPRASTTAITLNMELRFVIPVFFIPVFFIPAFIPETLQAQKT
jgi:hypothetical protein